MRTDTLLRFALQRISCDLSLELSGVLTLVTVNTYVFLFQNINQHSPDGRR